MNSFSKGSSDDKAFSPLPFDIESPTKTQTTKAMGLSESVEPLNLLNLSSLGEPDPSSIAKHDLLSAINFDR